MRTPTENQRLVAADYEYSGSLRETARRFNISIERVRQLVRCVEKLEGRGIMRPHGRYRHLTRPP